MIEFSYKLKCWETVVYLISCVIIIITKQIERNPFVKIIPINIHHSATKILSALERLDAVVFTGASDPLFKPMSKEKILEFFNNLTKYSSQTRPINTRPELRVYSRYFRKLKLILEYSENIYKEKGIRFPLIGTCLGLQAIITHHAGGYYRLGALDNVRHYNDLKLAKGLGSGGPFGKFMDKYLKGIVDKGRLFFSHHFGVLERHVRQNQKLESCIDIITTSTVKERPGNRTRMLPNNRTSQSEPRVWKSQKKYFQETGNKKFDLMTEQDLSIRQEKFENLFPNMGLDYTPIFLAVEDELSEEPFVTAFEMKGLPIYATQFHPTKMLFGYNNHEFIDSTLLRKYTNELFSIFFLSEIFKAKIEKLRKMGAEGKFFKFVLLLL